MDDTVQYAEVTFLNKDFQNGANRNTITITPYQPTTYSVEAAGLQSSSSARNYEVLNARRSSSIPAVWVKPSCWSLPLQFLHCLLLCFHVPQTIYVAFLVYWALDQCPSEDYWKQWAIEVVLGIWLLTDVIMTVVVVRAEIKRNFGRLVDWTVHLLIMFVAVGVLNVWVFPYCQPPGITIPEQVNQIIWWTYGLSFVVALVRFRLEMEAEGQRALEREWRDEGL